MNLTFSINNKTIGISADFKNELEFGAPKRVYIHAYNWCILIGEKSQTWSRKKGNTENWRFISWHPHKDLQCGKSYIGTYFGITKEWKCSRLKNHNGIH